MKKLLTFALCLLPVLLLAADESHQVLLNGKPFSRAEQINGVWEIPVADVARAAGMSLTLEPAFQLQGSTLSVKAGWDVKSNVKASAAAPGENAQTTTSGNAAFHDLSFTHKVDKASSVLLQACATGVHFKEATITHRLAEPSGGVVHPNGAIVSAHVINSGGRAMVPLADVVSACGGVWTPPANLPAGVPIQLHLAKNPNAALIVQ